jgi:hypothetical protein
MKFIATNKRNRVLSPNSIDFILTIDEIDKLIGFLNDTKNQFISRRADCFVSRIVKQNGERVIDNITKYDVLKELKYDVIEDHYHMIDSPKYNCLDGQDIIVHTMFKARKDENGGFTWVNRNDIKE